LHYKIDADIDHVAKFHSDRPRELGDPMANSGRITGGREA